MMMSIRTITAGILISVAMLCTGCNNKEGGEQKVTFAEDQYSKQHSDTRKPGPNAVVVTISDMKFQPENLTISKGDTVVFNNKDMVTHDMAEEKTKAWDSGPLAADASWRFVPTESSKYYCTLHPVMKGSITIR